ncbi:hypothetical protein TBK1r_35220 [Stieleria magnilauensis]|uniref:Uncharacterized protein n=1 Tax=Stieleria magnilauensis TaxID=2527963 RepID=A0ABX5XV83_9BACT|nr:hypothetical protein TBK1r_35220 [Planctomycetes bacterium TBK1r]
MGGNITDLRATVGGIGAKGGSDTKGERQETAGRLTYPPQAVRFATQYLLHADCAGRRYE